MKTRSSMNLKRITQNYIIITFASKTKKHDTDRNVKKKKKHKKVPSRKLMLPVRNRAAEDCRSTRSRCWSSASAKPQTRGKPSEMKTHQDRFNTESRAGSTLTARQEG